MEYGEILRLAEELGVSDIIARIPQESLVKFAEAIGCMACAPKQAELDRLMLEHCPQEMTPAQLETWAANQRPSVREAHIIVNTARHCEAQNKDGAVYELNIPEILKGVPAPILPKVYCCKNAKCVFQSSTGMPCNVCDGQSHFLPLVEA